MAYKNNGTANFNFFLNRQGPRGPQGIQGPQGFSPIVSVEEDVGNTFTLRVTNQDSSFVTSNLREHKEDRGGDYVRYDREGQLMYFGDPDFATTLKAGVIRLSTVEDLTNASEEVALTPKIYKDDITTRVQEINQRIDDTNTNVTQVDNRVTVLDSSTVKLTGNQTIEGTKTFSSKVRTQGVELGGNNIIQMDAGNITIGGGNTNRIDLTSNRGATLNSKNILTEANIPSSTTQPLKMENGLITVQVDNQTIQVQDGKLHANLDELGNEVNAIAGDVAALQADLLGKQAKLTAGENITISTDNVISATPAAPENMVTTDSKQSIIGHKTFRRVIIDSIAGRLLTNNIYDADNVLVLERYLDGISVGNSSHKDSELKVQGGFKLKLYNDQGSATNKGYILAQNTVTAGDNVTITKTTEGIKISATGGGTGSLPIATTTTLGGIKVGENLSITEDGTLSATGSGSAPSNMLTTDTDQTITGAKTLDNNLYVNNPDMVVSKSISTEELYCNSIELGKVWTSKNSNYIYTDGYRRISAIAKNGASIPMITCNTSGANPNIISLGVSDAYSVIIPAGAKTYSNKKYLTQGSIAAGSDNLVIADTTDGIKITCNAPTNEQIGQILESIADLSTKINNLTNRVTALEETIDGGIA